MVRDPDHRDRFDYNGARRFTPGVRTHGTISCYRFELRNKIPTCDDCRAAARETRSLQRARARRGRVT